MITVPPEIQECFHQFLYKESVPVNKHHYYKKWFNYYWDFCHKYLHPIAEKESLFYFIEKLREKQQKDFQIQQASHAVSIYYNSTIKFLNFVKKNSALHIMHYLIEVDIIISDPCFSQPGNPCFSGSIRLINNTAPVQGNFLLMILMEYLHISFLSRCICYFFIVGSALLVYADTFMA